VTELALQLAEVVPPQATDGAGALSQTMLVTAVVAQIVTFASVVVGLIFSYVRDGRAREWAKEDREFLARQTATTAERLAAHASAVSTGLKDYASERADTVLERLDTLTADVSEVKVAADDAYKEANHVNLKLEKISLGNTKIIDEAALAQMVVTAIRAELARRRATDPT
jgi:hypothetical protein